MGLLMDLIAGDPRELLLAISLEDVDGLPFADRFDAHLALGAGLDPTWLDVFSAAVRAVTGRPDPADFSAACRALDGLGAAGERSVERVDPAWITAVAAIGDRQIDAVAGSWIDLLGRRSGAMAADDTPAVADLAHRLVAFARAADASPAVLFAWTI